VKFLVPLFVLFVSIVAVGCSDSPNATQSATSTSAPVTRFVPTADLVLTARADRTDIGQVVISGVTNLPDGLKMWIEVEVGHLPLGAPKDVATDENVIVTNGKFETVPLWLEVPNTRFAKKGWPKSVDVSVRQVPFPAGQYKVHFDSYFNGAWQTPAVLAVIGGGEGKRLKGPILKPTDADVIDSPKIVDYRLMLPFGTVTSAARAVSLVRAAVPNVPDKGHSAGDVQANLDLYMSSPGLRQGKGWSATPKSPTVFEVSYDFMNGGEGEQQAVWTANIASGEVKYVNENAKTFSWTPNY
jgi:hypothetical protein